MTKSVNFLSLMLVSVAAFKDTKRALGKGLPETDTRGRPKIVDQLMGSVLELGLRTESIGIGGWHQTAKACVGFSPQRSLQVITAAVGRPILGLFAFWLFDAELLEFCVLQRVLPQTIPGLFVGQLEPGLKLSDRWRKDLSSIEV